MTEVNLFVITEWQFVYLLMQRSETKETEDKKQEAERTEKGNGSSTVAAATDQKVTNTSNIAMEHDTPPVGKELSVVTAISYFGAPSL